MQSQLSEEVFKTSMAMLFKKYKYEMSDTELRMYWERFKDSMDDRQFLAAVAQILDTFIPSNKVNFPLYPHFIGAVGSLATNPSAKRSVNAVKTAVRRFGRYDSVNFGDSKLHQTIKYYGGWLQICNWTDKDWEVKEKAFIETYNTMQFDSKFTHLPGIHEHNNTGKYPVEPPKLIYEHMKEKPLEILGGDDHNSNLMIGDIDE